MKKITIELIIRDDDDGVEELMIIADQLGDGYTGGHNSNEYGNSYNYGTKEVD